MEQHFLELQEEEDRRDSSWYSKPLLLHLYLASSVHWNFTIWPTNSCQMLKLAPSLLGTWLHDLLLLHPYKHTMAIKALCRSSKLQTLLKRLINSRHKNIWMQLTSVDNNDNNNKQWIALLAVLLLLPPWSVAPVHDASLGPSRKIPLASENLQPPFHPVPLPIRQHDLLNILIGKAKPDFFSKFPLIFAF